MMNTNEPAGGPNGNRHCHHGHPAIVSGAFAQQMVNIAGIGCGDMVVCIGDSPAAVETAVCGKGAHIISPSLACMTGKGEPLRFSGRVRADVILWAGDEDRQIPREVSPAAFRQHLRTGGRLVIWATPDRCRDVNALSRRLQSLIAEADWSNVIVGRLSSGGSAVVVATGILKPDLKAVS